MQSLPLLLLWERCLLPDEHGGHHCQQIRLDNLPRPLQLHLQQDQHHLDDIRCVDVLVWNDLAAAAGAMGDPGPGQGHLLLHHPQVSWSLPLGSRLTNYLSNRKDGKSPKKFFFIFGFLLPCIAIILCYSAIFYRVRQSR